MQRSSDQAVREEAKRLLDRVSVAEQMHRFSLVDARAWLDGQNGDDNQTGLQDVQDALDDQDHQPAP